MSKKIRHRGPDWSGIYCGKTAILCHERLSIVDPQSGGQPLFSPDRKQILAVNGEIYNHRQIRELYAGRYDFQTGSDCEVILALYRDKGIHFLEDLNGIFAFALYDEEQDDFLIARDPIGVIPLYFFIPFTSCVFLSLQSEKATDKNVVIIDNLYEPTRIHNNDLLATIIFNLVFMLVALNGVLNNLNRICRNYNRFNFGVLLDSKIGDKEIGYARIQFITFLIVRIIELRVIQ